MQYYDIIGDVHGCASHLERLLTKLGYRLINGVYQHPTRQAIFVGDYIDRGHEEKRTVDIIKAMCKAKSALAIMGNHEFNAICYATPHPDKPDSFLRVHSSKNWEQHEDFLKEYPLNSPQHADIIAWFKTLPVFLELPGLRVVHACWHTPSIEKLKTHLNNDNTLPDSMYFTASQDGHEHWHLIENVVKAIEHDLPEGLSFNDGKGHERTRVRIKWWSNETPTYRNLALSVPEDSLQDMPDTIIDDVYVYDEEKPVFFGHYWMRGQCQLQSKYVACVDYSAIKGGQLVAYRWSGETQLDVANFVAE